MNTALWALVKQAASSGQLQGGRPYTKNFWYVGQNIPVFAQAQRTNTIAQALLKMVDGDVLLLGDQTYDEGNLVVPVGLDSIAIIGCSNYGKTSIAPSTAAFNGINIKSNFVELINIDVAAGSAGTYAVKAGFETTTSLNGFRAYNCKFEGGSTASLWLHGMSDTLLRDIEIAWGTNGMRLQANSHGLCTEVFLDRSRFHNITTDHIQQSANQAETDVFDVRDCTFDNAEGGTAPTHFVNLQHNGNSGSFSGNRFALATNAIAKLVIGTGIKWMANATEAGWSSARPA